MQKKLLVINIAVAFIFFIIGYTIGFSSAVKIGIKIAETFIEVDFNEEAIEYLFQIYGEQIYEFESRYNTLLKNASLFHNTGN